MGIKNKLVSYLNKNCPEAFVSEPIDFFAFRKVAVDVSIYANKYKASAGEQWFDAIKHLINFIHSRGIEAIYVFDGHSPQEKKEERDYRRLQREKIIEEIQSIENWLRSYKLGDMLPESLQKKINNISLLNPDLISLQNIYKYLEKKKKHAYILKKEDYLMLAEYLFSLEIPTVTAYFEAEAFCAQLAKSGQVDAVLSEDSDLLAYGTPLTITRLSISRNICTVIYYENILKHFNITNEQFLDICILCGSDYNSSIKDVGPVSSIELIKQYENIEGILRARKIEIGNINYQLVRNIYRHQVMHKTTCY